MIVNKQFPAIFYVSFDIENNKTKIIFLFLLLCICGLFDL